MKSLKSYINECLLEEAKNTEAMFMGKISKRTEEDFAFTPGEKAILIKYTTHRYVAQLRGVYDIKKVNKNSISIDSANDFEAGLKFDKYGIAVVKNKNKYLGNSTDYWVLYNKALIDDKDLQELLKDGTCLWGFSFSDKDENKKRLQKWIDEVNQ